MKSQFIRFEDMYKIINLSFVYIGLGETFRTRKRSTMFCRIQTALFIYMTIMSAWGGFTGIAMFFYITLNPDIDDYTVQDAAQTLPPCFLDVLTVVVNVIIFLKKEKNIQLITEFKNIYPMEENVETPIRKILTERMKPVKMMIKCYTILTNLQPFLYSLIPVYISLFSNDEFVTPFTMWYPYDFKQSVWKYLATLYHQLIAATYTAFSLAAVDCAIVIVMVNISMHLEILSNRLQCVAPEKENYSTEELRIVDDKLKNIVKDHIHIIRLTHKFQSIFSAVFLCKYVASIALICQCLFSIMISANNRKFNFLLFLSSTLTQMFIICYYGHDIIEKSEDLSRAAYNSPWCSLNKRFAQNTLIVQARSQQALELNAMGFARVSLEAFTTIVKAGWSYFSIARQLYAPNSN